MTDRLVTVCAACLHASCHIGRFRCANQVRIFTARVSHADHEQARFHIRKWLVKHFGDFGSEMEITCVKAADVVEIWDDRAVQVEKNTGRRVDGR